ncbi:tyrosine-type recombinase/integrase [Paenibacillus sp. IHBB 10380]|uniref:tyrosine-type recombinase/integrase n=1 Tax=Paenibacillus sp. IHBB 10380 TaxID=1566358 RepID=UPI0009E3F2D5|nr:site-specific integrase [Paenibacillus sp. IHBB 10380]
MRVEGFHLCISRSIIKSTKFLELWLTDYKEGTVRKNTLTSLQYSINNHILPYFKNILLKELKPIMYQEFINVLITNGYSHRTIEIVHSTMNNSIKKAVTLYKIEKKPCVGVSIKGKKKQNGIKYIESSDIPKFLQAAYQYDYIYWIMSKLLIETGMRKGEAAALQWSDVDFKNKTLSISKTLDFTAKDSEELMGDPKTFDSTRTIRISQDLINNLKDHVKYQNQNKLGFMELYHHDLNLVLSRKDGNFMPKSSLFNAFSRILKRASIPSLPIHSLGHTSADMLLESGANMEYVQERLGHGSIQITSDVYAHISKKIEETNMNKFEEHLKNVLE